MVSWLNYFCMLEIKSLIIQNYTGHSLRLNQNYELTCTKFAGLN